MVRLQSCGRSSLLRCSVQVISVCPICSFTETLTLLQWPTSYWKQFSEASKQRLPYFPDNFYSTVFLQQHLLFRDSSQQLAFSTPVSLELVCILFRKVYCVRRKNSSNYPVPRTGRFLRIQLSVHLSFLSLVSVRYLLQFKQTDFHFNNVLV